MQTVCDDSFPGHFCTYFTTLTPHSVSGENLCATYLLFGGLILSLLPSPPSLSLSPSPLSEKKKKILHPPLCSAKIYLFPTASQTAVLCSHPVPLYPKPVPFSVLSLSTRSQSTAITLPYCSSEADPVLHCDLSVKRAPYAALWPLSLPLSEAYSLCYTMTSLSEAYSLCYTMTSLSEAYSLCYTMTSLSEAYTLDLCTWWSSCTLMSFLWAVLKGGVHSR